MKFSKRLLCALLTTLLVLSLIPVAVSAGETPLGTVTVSFEDYGVRRQGETVDFPQQLGEIIPPTQVPFYEGDNIADVTLRLLDTLEIGYSNMGSPDSGFYLSSIKNFENAVYGHVNSFGEFDSGSMSGWMITLNDWFINMGASEFAVEDGDIIRWQNTCQYGADIGCDWMNASAEITGLVIDKQYGTLSPQFDEGVENYALTVPSDINAVKLKAQLENYWSTVTYRVGETPYKLLRDIPVENGTQIVIESAFAEYAGNPPTDTDRVVITIVKATNYTVTVNVGPSGDNVSFYKCDGFDSDGYDILGDSVTSLDNGVVSGYHSYTLSVPAGTYSFRGTDTSGNSLGGMTFDVTADNQTVTLRQFEGWAVNLLGGQYLTVNDYTYTILDADGRKAVSGSSYLNGNYTRYRFMLYAGGNTELYVHQITPSAAITSTYGVGTFFSSTDTVGVASTTATKSVTLPTLVNATINAPDAAQVVVNKQIRNYYTQTVAPYSSVSNGDGTTNYIYKLPKNDTTHTYRVSMHGKITKAGFIKLSADITYTLQFGADENPQVRPTYNTSTSLGKMMEDNLLLNINKQNYLRMQTGDTFKARAYRAAWQITIDVVNNIMIEPDFHYNIISGDSVTFTQDGRNAMLTAVKPGVTVFEVTYDAIEIGGNTTYTGIYGAIDPVRKGLFAVNVDGDTATPINFNIGDWDSEMDTVYFTGEQGTFTFTPSAALPISVKVNGNVQTADGNGAYTLPVVEGNNLVEVTSGSTVEYLVLKGNKVIPNISNVTNPGQPLKQGDTVKINFSGLHMSVPKFSGIYNPGYGNTMKVSYTLPDGSVVTNNGTQYDFINNHDVTFKVYSAGTYTLSGGCMPMTMMCNPTNPWGQHRTLTDMGVGANFSASEVKGVFSTLPDLTFNVAKSGNLTYLDSARTDYATLQSATILCGNSTIDRSFYFGVTKPAGITMVKNSTTTSFTTPAPGVSYPFTVAAVPVGGDVQMEFRYWEEGATSKTVVPIQAGITNNLGINPFSGNTTVNMEIAVVPNNPLYGDGTKYSFIAYKNTAGFPAPVLSGITVKDSAGVAYAGNYGVLHSDNGGGLAYTQTNYSCYVPADATSVKITPTRLIGAVTITVNGQTVATGGTSNAIALTGDQTTIPMTITYNGTRNYSLNIIRMSELNIAKAKAKDILSDAMTFYQQSGAGAGMLNAISTEKTAGDAFIDAATVSVDVETAKTNAFFSMQRLATPSSITLNIDSITKTDEHTVALNVSNLLPSDVTGSLLVGIFNGNRLVEIKTLIGETFTGGQTDQKQVSFNGDISLSSLTVRAFVWEGVGNARPLAYSLNK